MATHSSVLAWRIPRTGEPGGLPSLGSHRVRHDWSDSAAAAAAAARYHSTQHSMGLGCENSTLHKELVLLPTGSATPVLSPGKPHGWRSLVGCSPWGREESDTTERLHFHFSLSCIGEGNGNPLQCSCLENTRDGGAWWAAIYGVTKSQTWLKQLSSSSSPSNFRNFSSKNKNLENLKELLFVTSIS